MWWCVCDPMVTPGYDHRVARAWQLRDTLTGPKSSLAIQAACICYAFNSNLIRLRVGQWLICLENRLASAQTPQIATFFEPWGR